MDNPDLPSSPSDAGDTPEPSRQRVSFTEGSVALPGGYDDRTTNLFVPPNTQVQPNLSVARDHMRPGETLPRYVDRQLSLLKSQLASHKLLAREPVQLGRLTGEGADAMGVLSGERIDASYRNGKVLVYQRQAAFEVAPGRMMIFTGSSARGFNEAFERLWAEWLASYEPPPAGATASV